MKNIQVVDGSENRTCPILQATEDEFALVFPGPAQDIQFAEGLDERALRALAPVWSRPAAETDAVGIHGTLFYGYEKSVVTPLPRSAGATGTWGH